MFYLSVHDLVWINSLIAGDGVPFDYELLEEAIAAQYGYGDSTDVLTQAADFVQAIAVGRPFERGNIRTALIALSVYLEGNGRRVNLDGASAPQAIRELASGTKAAAEVVELLLADGSGATLRRAPVVAGDVHAVMSRTTVLNLLDRAGSALDALAEHDHPVTDRRFRPELHRD